MDILDVQEERGPVPLLDATAAAQLLAGSHRIAMVGASDNPLRPSYGVMGQLIDAGYEVVPVNPNADTVMGARSYPTLEEAAAAGAIDIVDVFRRPEHTPDIARSAVAVGARALWLQLGVVNWEAARIAHDAGLAVVMDRCTAIELRRIR
jgi:predicted CoA-binding protein